MSFAIKRALYFARVETAEALLDAAKEGAVAIAELCSFGKLGLLGRLARIVRHICDSPL
jgi:hypothetical protein